LTVKFEQGKAYLFIDGKLDTAIDSPLPAPCTGEINVGIASGDRYNFNGVIRSIKVYQVTTK